MAIIDSKTWLKETSRLGLSRSPELKAIDTAFVNFEKLGTGAAKKSLVDAFEAWKKKQGVGDAWLKSSRNSNGSAEKLGALLSGEGDTDSAFGRGRTPDFMHEELINARLGVLYLFSRVTVAPGLFKMLLEGGLDLAGEILDVSNASESVTKNFSKASDIAKKGGGVGNYIEGKLIKQVQPKNMSLPEGAKPSILAGRGAT
ncbi:MAG: hypothetical protein ABIT38_03985, partial [Gemmatimonadaceae bacterium]